MGPGKSVAGDGTMEELVRAKSYLRISLSLSTQRWCVSSYRGLNYILLFFHALCLVVYGEAVEIMEDYLK